MEFHFVVRPVSCLAACLPIKTIYFKTSGRYQAQINIKIQVTLSKDTSIYPSLLLYLFNEILTSLLLYYFKIGQKVITYYIKEKKIEKWKFIDIL